MNKNPEEDMNTQPHQAAGEGITSFSTDNQLTIREKEVLRMVAEGNNSNEIAILLFISEDTVQSHQKNIIKKLGAKNTAHAVAHALRNNLLH